MNDKLYAVFFSLEKDIEQRIRGEVIPDRAVCWPRFRALDYSNPLILGEQLQIAINDNNKIK